MIPIVRGYVSHRTYITIVFSILAFTPFRQPTTDAETSGRLSRKGGTEVTEAAKDLKSSRPVIDVWYGSHQIFGRPGVPQRWMNILGNVSDPDGISSLTFSINGIPGWPVSIGPDYRRLLAPGDFNIEINRTLLDAGLNHLVIRATDNLDNQATATVTIEYEANTWPLPYSVRWESVTNIQDVAQVIDGFWVLEAGGIRTHPDYVGYDRVIAIGDVSWKNYEVTVPFTIHAIDSSAYGSPISVCPSFGINLHWLGHTNSPVVCPRLHCGWEPIGGSNWYEFRKTQNNGLRIIAKPSDVPSRIIDLRLEMGKTYWLRARVESTHEGNLYSLKFWDDGHKQPFDWDLQKFAGEGNLASGSFLLVAHHVDMTFGNITVVPVVEHSTQKR
jgi:hypothetical protein